MYVLSSVTWGGRIPFPVFTASCFSSRPSCITLPHAVRLTIASPLESLSLLNKSKTAEQQLQAKQTASPPL